jgi:putative transposase
MIGSVSFRKEIGTRERKTKSLTSCKIKSSHPIPRSQAMPIVITGKQNLQVVAEASNRHEFIEQLERELVRVVKATVSQCLNSVMEDEVSHMLRRKHYTRRKKSVGGESPQARCNGCASRKVKDFRRNGHRTRGLDTSWGHLSLQVPQIECQCGHAVKMAYGTLESRQRIWDDLAVEIRAEYGRGLSLRCIKDELDGLLGGSLGLRTLNQRVLAIEKYARGWQTRPLADLPPVIRLDGLWVVLMIPTGEERKDARGRKRAVKRAKRIPVLMAQGVWPVAGRQEVLTWRLGTQEDQADWQDLLFQLRLMGVTAQHLALLIGDGSPGLEAALRVVYEGVPFQRCIFHKMRNVLQALVSPEVMDRPALRAYQQPLVESLSAIWQAKTEGEARQRQQAFCQQWGQEQPKAVATLQRDFDLTLTFYQVRRQAAQRGEVYPAEALRTTSQLERENRGFRKRIRAAVLFHSSAGLTAALYQNQVFRESLSQVGIPGEWIVRIERQIEQSRKFLN